MRNVVLYLALAVAAFAAPTQAQVFKCAGPAGSPTYSDRPCDQGRGMVLMQRERSWQELADERAIAAEAQERKYRARRDERERQMMEHQMRLSQQRASQFAHPPRNRGATPECTAAKKELEFVSSIRTVSQDEKRMRTNAAISNVNAACGSNTPLMQEPPRIYVDSDGGSFIDQNGRSCSASGGMAICH